VATYELIKYQALGNDYLVLDLPADLDSLRRLLPILCDRQRGLGSDGLLAFDRERMSVRILNPDGSEAEKSGNGLRIVACHAILEHEAPERFLLHTQDHANAVRVLSVGGPEVWSAIEIGRPRFVPDEWVELETRAGSVRARLVEVGNPHCVVFGEPVTESRARELGPLLERHPRFPNRTNVQLAEVRDPSHLSAVIWERGAGYTLASGTSASAVAAAAMRVGLADDEVAVEMPGGTLTVRRLAGGELEQSGPARRVYRAVVDTADLV
jgi:diaminopimelate epimerase